ncbi:MAG: GGDEF domain-containing protein [Lachnospiraceae bacterium]|nr:GGDEF domain-containing protein [Lachnospiraceae bacterium]
MKETNFLHKLYQNICKDTGDQNESAKLIVVIRFLILSMIVYSLISSGLCLAAPHIGGMIFCQISAVLFLAIFVLSYHNRTFVSFCILNAYILVWIMFNIIMFGWNIGVQHFIIVLLVACFFAKYKHGMIKAFYALALCILRICLFLYCQNNVPQISLRTDLNNLFQVINTIAIFWSISLIAYIFSTDTQTLECKLVEYNEQLKKQANVDPLTGLYNRRSTLEYLEKLLKAPEHEISICLCDIDFFKRVNDTYGHDVGDIVLKKISETFRKELPAGTFISRWGGEEFLLIFPISNGDEAHIFLETLRQKVKAIDFDGGSENFSVSLTFGLVEYDFHSDLTTILKQADEKLYLGKESGRDRIIF